jgi:hypothetical protein
LIQTQSIYENPAEMAGFFVAKNYWRGDASDRKTASLGQQSTLRPACF